MKRLTLYGTSACHLCELAQDLLDAQPGLGMSFTYDKVDISESDELFERYGLRIPVVHDTAGGRELGWPFDSESLLAFVQGTAE